MNCRCCGAYTNDVECSRCEDGNCPRCKSKTAPPASVPDNTQHIMPLEQVISWSLDETLVPTKSDTPAFNACVLPWRNKLKTLITKYKAMETPHSRPNYGTQKAKQELVRLILRSSRSRPATVPQIAVLVKAGIRVSPGATVADCDSLIQMHKDLCKTTGSNPPVVRITHDKYRSGIATSRFLPDVLTRREYADGSPNRAMPHGDFIDYDADVDSDMPNYMDFGW